MTAAARMAIQTHPEPGFPAEGVLTHGKTSLRVLRFMAEVQDCWRNRE